MFLAGLLTAVDQTTKLMAQHGLENHPDIVLIPNLLSFHFVRNEISHSYQYLSYFPISFVVYPAAILYFYAKSYYQLVIMGMTLLWTAVLSNNIIDVFALGYIRDFIKLHGIAVGNVADQYRNAGVVLVVMGLMIKDKKELSPGILLKSILAALAVLTMVALLWRHLAKYWPI